MSLNCRHALTNTVGLKSRNDRESPGTDSTPFQDADSKLSSEDEEDWIVCRQCGQRLAKHNERMSVNGSHKHTFANPSGLLFEICCYAQARGCSPYGAPSSEFAWFASHTWQIIICSKCLTHLGWLFVSKDSRRFYGLITERISEMRSKAGTT